MKNSYDKLEPIYCRSQNLKLEFKNLNLELKTKNPKLRVQFHNLDFIF